MKRTLQVFSLMAFILCMNSGLSAQSYMQLVTATKSDEDARSHSFGTQATANSKMEEASPLDNIKRNSNFSTSSELGEITTNKGKLKASSTTTVENTDKVFQAYSFSSRSSEDQENISYTPSDINECGYAPGSPTVSELYYGNWNQNIYADNIVVEAGKEFSLESIEIYFLYSSTIYAPSVGLSFYDGCGNQGPGNDLNINWIEDHLGDRGTVLWKRKERNFFGVGINLDVIEITFEEPIIFSGGSYGETYWLGSQVEGTATYGPWALGADAVDGSQSLYIYDGSMESWFHPSDYYVNGRDQDLFYFFHGECRDINTRDIPVNNDWQSATSLSVTAGLPTHPIAGTMQGSTATLSCVLNDECGDWSTAEDVWYKLTIPASEAVVVELYATGGGTSYDNDFSIQLYREIDSNTLFYELCNEDYTIEKNGEEEFGWPINPIAYMPRIAFTGPSGLEVLVRVRKSADSRNDFYISAYDPTQILPLSDGACMSGASVSITKAAGNAYRDVPLLDAEGKLVAELFTGGEELGEVTSSSYVNDGSVRQDGNGIYFLDRNSSIDVEYQPTQDVVVAIYFLESEMDALRMVDPTFEEVEDVNLTLFEDGCGGLVGAGGGTWLHGAQELPQQGDITGVVFLTDHFSDFFIHGGNSPLPVTLTSFDARLMDNNSVLLHWNVVDEINLDGYVIERSTDGRNFDDIAMVQAENQPSYRIIDSQAKNGVNYYRLRMVDRDHSFSTSEIRKVVFTTSRNIMLYPNPATERFFIGGLEEVQAFAQISIFNEIGKLVLSSTMNGSGLAGEGIDMSGLPAGTYHVKVTSEAKTEVMRLVKQ